MNNEDYPPRSGDLPAAPRSALPQAGSRMESWDLIDPEPVAQTRAPVWRRYVGAVLRHRWPILGLVIAGTVGATWAAQHLPLEYEAQSTIWISAQDARDRTGPIRSSELLQSNAWIELLRSYVVLDAVVREQRLYLKPAAASDSLVFSDFRVGDRFVPGAYRLLVDGRSYTLQTDEGIRIESGTLGGPIGRELGFLWQPAAGVLRNRRSVEFEVAVPREAAVELNNALRTRIDQDANFLRLELRRRTGEEAARVLNAVAERYVEVAGELKLTTV